MHEYHRERHEYFKRETVGCGRKCEERALVANAVKLHLPQSLMSYASTKYVTSKNAL
jgi:hypothetical protein